MLAAGVALLLRHAAVIDALVRFLEWQIGFARTPAYRRLVKLLGWLFIANGLLWSVALLTGRAPLAGVL